METPESPSPASPQKGGPARSARPPKAPTRIHTTTLIADALLASAVRRASNERLENRPDVVAGLRLERGKIKQKSLDLGSPVGPYDTNSVRERIRNWQSQGGGVIEQKDPAIYPAERTPTVSEVGPVEKARKVPLGVPAPARAVKETTRPSREKRKDNYPESKTHPRQEKRSASTPRKRVISDGHWRQNESAGRGGDSTSGFGRASGQISTSKRHGIKLASRSENTDQRRNNGGTAPSPSKPDYENDGIRVYSSIKLNNSQPNLESGPNKVRKSSASEIHGQSDKRRSSSHSPPRKFSRSHPKDNSAGKAPKPSLDAVAAAVSAEEFVRKRKVSNEKEAAHEESQYRNIHRALPSRSRTLKDVFAEGKKIFAKASEPQPPAPLHPAGNRIEAWLVDTPDPFVDSQDPMIETAASVHSLEQSLPDDNTLNAHVARLPSLRRNHGSKGSRNTKKSSSNNTKSIKEETELSTSSANYSELEERLINVAAKLPPLSPASLKRAGAKRVSGSPTRDKRKGSPLKESFSSSDSNQKPLQDRIQPLQTPYSLPARARRPLSTIASVETFVTQSDAIEHTTRINSQDGYLKQTKAQEPRIQSNPSLSGMPFESSGLKRRLTTHANLISVLSFPQAGDRSIRSARSIRTSRTRLATATIGDVMKELVSDEVKYMRELRTLFDGVIPVLLNCVLSRADSAVAAGLFRPSASKADPSITRPIMEMGIALQRLKSLHKRIPQEDASQFLLWANGAQRVYTEYLKSWRIGFQDVVINLAPPNPQDAEDDTTKSELPSVDEVSLFKGLPRNADGDVVDNDGERVDVAFLLKRPLVRLKYLAKTARAINYILPSTEAEAVASKFQSLVIDARRKTNEERARMEDESAANIDPTRARDPRTLGPLSGVIVDQSRHVRARDYFNLELQHSSGQRLDCKVELLLRDDTSERGSSGDLLISEVDETGRWLLFPPILFGRVSARNGDAQGQIIVMIRGLHGHMDEWQELLLLSTDDEQTGFEWVQMLGLSPVPPKIQRQHSFQRRKEEITVSKQKTSSCLDETLRLGESRTPSPREIEIPIGEHSTLHIRSNTKHPTSSTAKEPIVPTKHESRRDYSDASSASSVSTVHAKPMKKSPASPSLANVRSRRESPLELKSPPRDLNEAMLQAGNLGSPLKRSKAKRQPPAHDEPISQGASSGTFCQPSYSNGREPSDKNSPPDHRSFSYEVKRSNDRWHIRKNSKESLESRDNEMPESPFNYSPKSRRSLSPIPSILPPIIPKVRKSSQPSTPPRSPSDDGQDFQFDDTNSELSSISTALSKSQLSSQVGTASDISQSNLESAPPPPPPHRSQSSFKLKTLKLLDANLPPTPLKKTARRSSSPLKHQYEPSTASEGSIESELSASEDGEEALEGDDASAFSETSQEEELEDGDAPTPLLPMAALQRFGKISCQESIYSVPNATLTPSQSASQAPYKSVPHQPAKASKAIACIYSWSDKGCWESLFPDECSIVITPGLIEAYEMGATHSRPVTVDTEPPRTSTTPLNSPLENGDNPLVALELTPLVPLRRGTALDISIRSPPTSRSKITSGTNVMFRSRNPEECEALYAAINTSRINNPTYLALQNARGPYDGISSSHLAHRASQRGTNTGGSWWTWTSSKSSYRANSLSRKDPSIAGASDSSVGSFASAFSALKRFGQGSKMFNIGKSTISLRGGSASTSIFSSSSNSSFMAGTTHDTPASPTKDDSLGLSNAKIRLYARETASKWRDMGSARLSITRAPDLPPSLLKYGHTGSEKRILIRGMSKSETLLDVCLGESCFERVARTGIALSVWEEVVGPNGEIGQVGAIGGVSGRTRVFMIQMKTEAETAYTFSIVGKQRY
ncbi:MAG: hypothetical protein M1829_001150 [Trizodia sp. TS-e1964]|nr:MAG: hypothetical protein M1829_001150 [Trizodia sp. TS-e1964]